MKRKAIILVAVLAAANCLWAKKGPKKISDDLAGVNPLSTVNVIVRFTHAPDEPHFKKVTTKGGVLKNNLGLINGASFAIPAALLDALGSDPQVSFISLDRPVKPTMEFAYATVGANIARQYGWTGRGVGVAVIDSGITVEADLKEPQGKSRIVYSKSFVPGLPASNDQYGHGTHVAGIIGGNAADSTGLLFTKTFRGIAPDVNLINLRVLDAQGASSDSTVIAAIQEAIRLKDTYNIRVINLSLGRPIFESYTQDPLCQAVEAAWKAGIVVVVAAGNEGRNNDGGINGYGTITSPANDPYVITVGAMKDMGTIQRGDDLIASYSSKGPTLIDHIVKPDLVAPGNRIVSVEATGTTLVKTAPDAAIVPLNYYVLAGSTRASNSYVRLNGTSMAAPMVSGAAALLLQKEPGLTPDAVKARLMKTATKTFPSYSVAIEPSTGVAYTSQYDMFTVGAGYLDIAAALNSPEVAAGTAVSPTAVYDPATGTVSINNTVDPDGSSAAWSSRSVWGKDAGWDLRSVWGSAAFVGGTSAAWGNSACWGAATTTGFNNIWGESAAWGSRRLTGMAVLLSGE